MDLRFQRRLDGSAHEFAQVGTADGYPIYQRSDVDLWCRRLSAFGWSVCTDSDEVLSRPFADAGHGDLPPAGMWVSAKGDQAYVYDMTMLTTPPRPHNDGAPSDPFSVPITARGYEVDANGHVPATTLLAYAQHARWQCLRAAGIDAHELQRTGVGPISLEEKIRFHQELRPGEEIDATCAFVWTEGKKTFSVHQELRRRPDGTLIAEITNVGGLLDLTERRLISNPGARWRAVAERADVLGL